MSSPTPPSWTATLSALTHPRVVTMLFLGFAAGLPLLLIFSSLSLWLREAGHTRSVVTMFSWAALGYSFKFVWAPLIDTLPLPYLTSCLGRRRSWILLSQLAIITAIIGMALQDPTSPTALTFMAAFAVMLGFSSATQDIVIDAYRIESAPPRLQALMSSTYIAGYRIGMLIAGAGALILASHYGTTLAAYHYPAWRAAYLWMAAFMLIGILTTLLIPEPATPSPQETDNQKPPTFQLLTLFTLTILTLILTYTLTSPVATALKASFIVLLDNRPLAALITETLRLTAALVAAALVITFLIRTRLIASEVAARSYIHPVLDFFRRHGRTTAWLILALIATYRISDIVLGVIANVFYQDLGFTKTQIATAAKTYGLILSIIGGFLGGALALRHGVIPILLTGAILSALTNLLFIALTAIGPSLPFLYVVLSADNLSAGLASAAFVAFLSALTNIRFTAVQYALFTSIMTLLPKALGGYSGAIVDNIGYPQFFLFTTLIGLPVLVLIHQTTKHLPPPP